MALLPNGGLNVGLRLGDVFIHLGGIDPTIGHHARKGFGGDGTADGIKARNRNDARRIVDQDIHSSGQFNRTDVATFTANDPSLHIIRRNLDRSNGGLGHMLGRTTLDRHEGDFTSLVIRLFLGGLHQITPHFKCFQAVRLSDFIKKLRAGLIFGQP